MKTTKRMESLFVLTLLSLSLGIFSACGTNAESDSSPAQNPNSSQPTPGVPVPETPEPVLGEFNQVCYIGDGSSERGACANLYDARDLPALGSDYEYLDPTRDPSFPNSFNPNWYFPPQRYINLTETSGALRVAPHFQLNEFAQSRKGRYGIFSRAVVEHLQSFRDFLGSPIFVNSGYRSPGYNAGISGSAKWSRHQYGDAIDFYSSRATLEELQELCIRAGASFTRLYATHIHCDWRANAVDPVFRDTELSLLGTSADHDHNGFVASAETMREVETLQSRIVTTADGERQVEFFLERNHVEDDAEVWIQWKIKNPKGVSYLGSGATIQVPFVAGEYLIDANIGGTYSVSDFSMRVTGK